jgi:hypothetical protein
MSFREQAEHAGWIDTICPNSQMIARLGHHVSEKHIKNRVRKQ